MKDFFKLMEMVFALALLIAGIYYLNFTENTDRGLLYFTLMYTVMINHKLNRSED